MNLKDTADKVADFLWDLVTSDPGDSVQKFTADPAQYLADHGHDGLTADDLDAAFGRLADRLPPDQLVQMAPMRAATQGMAPLGGGSAGLSPGPSMGPVLGSNASMAAHAVAAPRPQVVRHVTEQRVTHVREAPPPEVQPVTQQHVTQQHVTNHYVREGDTTVDNRTITEIHARGDVDFDQRIDTRTVVATKGGVAIDGDVEDAAINTGKNTGILAGDDVALEDSVVGKGNTQLNDSEVGAFSGRGNATNAKGQNVNTGSGDLTAVRAGGDAQVADGHGNRFSGDTDVDFDRVDGPANLTIGDGNRQQAEEDNATRADDSFNTDASTRGSANTAVEDSANSVSTDNDTERTDVARSFNQAVEDNDTTPLGGPPSPTMLVGPASPSSMGTDDPLAADRGDGPPPGQAQLGGPGLAGSQLDPADAQALSSHGAGDSPLGQQLGQDQLGGDQLGDQQLSGGPLFPSLGASPIDEFEDPDLDDI